MRFLFAAVGVLSVVSPAHAWNSLGHKVTASIAWPHLTVPTQTALIALLEEHHRFTEDFETEIPGDLDGGERAKWLLGQAAIWPDIARGFSGANRTKYHHSTWHYVNLPVFLGTEFEFDASDDVHVVEALRNAVATVRDKEAEEEDRAVALCWIAHLVGDMHQPLHTVALFTPERFPEGDRGGNSIRLSNSSNLHARWDSLIGSSTSVNNIAQRAFEVTHADWFPEFEASVPRSFLPAMWASDGRELAREEVYTPGVLAIVHLAEDDEDLPLIDLGEAYLTNAGDVARRQIAKAGLRLAAVLNELFGEKEACDDETQLELERLQRELQKTQRELSRLRNEA